MSTIFYTILFLLSISNVYLVILHSKIFRIREWWDGFSKIAKRLPTKNDYRNPQDFLLLNFWSIITICNYIFSIIGLLSSNWIVFSTLILASLISQQLTRKSKKYGIIHKITDLIGAILTSIIYLIISMNYFHFGYNLSELVLSFFG